jgi:hypothetical protein
MKFILFSFIFPAILCFFGLTIWGQSAYALGGKKITVPKVKTKTEYSYFYGKTGNSKYKNQIRYYDTNGNDTLVDFFSVTDGKVFSKQRQKFKSPGVVIELIEMKKAADSHLRGNKDSFYADRKIVNEYDNNGNRTAVYDYDKTGNLSGRYKSVYTYTQSGKIGEVNRYLNDSTFESREKNEYDAYDRLISNCTYNEMGKLKIKYEMLYDSLGNKIRVRCVNKFGVFKTDSMIYDKMGRKTLSLQYDSSYSLVSKISFRYYKSGTLKQTVKENIQPAEYKKLITFFNRFGLLTSSSRRGYNGEVLRQQKIYYTFY